MASFEVVAIGGELLNGVAAVQQLTLVTVDVSDS